MLSTEKILIWFTFIVDKFRTEKLSLIFMNNSAPAPGNTSTPEEEDSLSYLLHNEIQDPETVHVTLR